MTCTYCEDGYKPVLNGICDNESCEFSKVRIDTHDTKGLEFNGDVKSAA